MTTDLDMAARAVITPALGGNPIVTIRTDGRTFDVDRSIAVHVEYEDGSVDLTLSADGWRAALRRALDAAAKRSAD
ncbi:MAG: hypothetical protein Q8Q14_02695 [Gemmatimonadales bacterium]|nr:hypothetical protein [Gemmatimonadales bacterium]